jgi:regulator of replication initiation timing
MITPVEWLVRQIKGYESDCEIFQQAKEMEEQQNEKYNELKEVIEDIIEHLDEGRVLTLRKDSILVEALRNTINQ